MQARHAEIDPTIPPLLYRVQDVRRIAAVGHSKLYQLIADGILVARKAGSRTVITAESVKRYVDSLPAFIYKAGLPSHSAKKQQRAT